MEHEITKYQRAYFTDPTISRMIKSGASAEDVIAELSEQKARLVARIMELETIAPRKVRMPDGSLMVWHCPDHLVPELPAS